MGKNEYFTSERAKKVIKTVAKTSMSLAEIAENLRLLTKAWKTIADYEQEYKNEKD